MATATVGTPLLELLQWRGEGGGPLAHLSAAVFIIQRPTIVAGRVRRALEPCIFAGIRRGRSEAATMPSMHGTVPIATTAPRRSSDTATEGAPLLEQLQWWGQGGGPLAHLSAAAPSSYEYYMAKSQNNGFVLILVFFGIFLKCFKVCLYGLFWHNALSKRRQNTR